MLDRVGSGAWTLGPTGVSFSLGDFLLGAGLPSVLPCCLDHSDAMMALGASQADNVPVMMLRVVDKLGADKAPGVLGSILQLSLPQGEELETVEDRNCQGPVCLSQWLNVPVFYLKSGRSMSRLWCCPWWSQ